MTTYNGHPSWAYWNVSLWIANDESLYRAALACIRRFRNKRDAAAAFIDTLEDTKTPDGARYSTRAVIHAMQGLES